MATRKHRPLTLFGHKPLTDHATAVEWEGKGWSASIRKIGTTWEATYCGVQIGTAYAARGAAKTGIENEARRQLKRAKSVMGVV